MADGGNQHDGRMTLIEHLTEFRRRIIICAIAVAVCSIVMFFLYNHVLSFLSGPYEEVTKGQTGCGGTATTGCKLIVTGVLEPFLIRLKIAFYGGLALSVPIIMWEIWRFVTPALHKNERRYAVGFLFSGVLLFALGAVVAWFTVQKALEFLLGVGGNQLQPFITADKYLTLVTLMIAAFGVAFEFPLLLIFLLLARVVTTQQLRSIRRWAIVGIFVFAAVITPSQDPFSLLFMAIPMYVFYEIAIVIGRLLKR
ncbi:MAG TPA: twin-arginine translocase subunit TatC [Acidimicrobiia bacterium]|jgi:sec-independent protein translocase protein TatC|nr:twin-arginine translocase subunit TatC [Acidimicrobiia bacterium]